MMNKNKARKIAEKVWEDLHGFGGYAFPKAHATSYSLIANATIYLKAEYPLEFFCSFLNQADDKEYDQIKGVSSKDYGVEYSMPSINKSKVYFTIQDNRIVWPLTSIKGIGAKAAQSIIDNQPYSSFEDFFKKINKRVVNIKVIKLLIMAQAFKEFGNRNFLMKEFYKLRNNNEKFKSLSKQEWDVEASKIMPYFKQNVRDLFPDKLGGVVSYEKFLSSSSGRRVTIAGSISSIRYVNSKRGKMAIMNVTDSGDNYNVVLWSDFIKKLEENNKTLVKDSWVKVSGIKGISQMNEEQIQLGNSVECYVKILS